MNLRSRNQLLRFFVILFFILGPSAILFAYGWRLDLSHFRIVKVGGIFLKGLPFDASLYVDGRLLDSNGRKFLSGNLINGLLPKDYFIKVERPGYGAWEKTIRVEPSMVAETKPIVLIPMSSPAVLLEKPIDNFWINHSALIYRGPNLTYFLTDTDDLKSRINLSLLFNDLKERLLKFPGYVPITDIIPQESPSRWIINTTNFSYLIDTKKLTLELLGEKVQPAKPLLSPEQEKVLATFEEKYPGQIRSMSWYKDSAHLFIQYPNKVFFLELDDRYPLNAQLLGEGVTKYVYDNGRLYLLNGVGITYFEI